jgi:hypothetical protein
LLDAGRLLSAVLFRTLLICECLYTPFIMTFAYAREGVVAVWILTLVVVGLAVGITSLSGWLTLAGLALISLVILQRLWRVPEQTLSESINKARQ